MTQTDHCLLYRCQVAGGCLCTCEGCSPKTNLTADLAALPTVTCERCGGTGQVADDRKIGKRMRQARELSGHSQREVARRLGYSPAYLCDLEFGRRRWKPDVTRRYLRAIA